MSTDGPIYAKYNVQRIDGAENDPTSKHLGGCELFVLDLDHDPYARAAARAYAQACALTHPTLARDLTTLAYRPDENTITVEIGVSDADAIAPDETTTDHTPTPTGPVTVGIPSTPEELIVAAHARAARLFDEIMRLDRPGVVPRIIEMQANYALTLAMATLTRVSPADAAALAEDLHNAAEAGDSYGEWLWQWGEELQAGTPITLPFTLPEDIE